MTAPPEYNWCRLKPDMSPLKEMRKTIAPPEYNWCQLKPYMSPLKEIGKKISKCAGSVKLMKVLNFRYTYYRNNFA